MADIVNLRQVRKQKRRVENAADAERNRALHGRTRSEKDRDALSSDTSARFLEGHRRDRGTGGNDPE
jgi:hypothetical protein